MLDCSRNCEEKKYGKLGGNLLDDRISTLCHDL